MNDWSSFSTIQNRMTHSYRLIILLIIMVTSVTGCLESSFTLAPESRLPKWFEVDKGMRRDDFSLQMELHSAFSGAETIIKLYKRNRLFALQEYTVTTKEQPRSRCEMIGMQGKGFMGYPCYMAISVNNIVDVIELRKMEPVFYMTDDPVVWKELGVERRNEK